MAARFCIVPSTKGLLVNVLLTNFRNLRKSEVSNLKKSRHMRLLREVHLGDYPVGLRGLPVDVPANGTGLVLVGGITPAPFLRMPISGGLGLEKHNPLVRGHIP